VIGRRGYLDWLRGIAVVIMIQGHTLDSWTRVADRSRAEYGWVNVVGGLGGAPIFLVLAGLAMALGAGSQLRKGASDQQATARLRRRGWQIFGLAFLFRLQSLVVSGGSWDKLFKVDILNVMGVAMLAAAALWQLGRQSGRRALLLALAAVAVAMLTPIVRATPLFDPVPDLVEWYIRAPGGQTTFTLFPWAGFLLAGAALGVWLDRAQAPTDERRVHIGLAIGGSALAAAAYGASYLPAIYQQTEFWTSSPTFFFFRLGVVMAALPLAYALRRTSGRRSRIEELGVASLFVYWIHVELAYGSISAPIHRALPLEAAAIAFVLFTWLMYGTVKLKQKIQVGRPNTTTKQNPGVGSRTGQALVDPR
jgi:uncharacterized membrane protein